jgi:cellobiose phosphorylase
MIESYTAREEEDSSLKVARETFPNFFISDAREINLTENRIFSVSLRGQSLPLISAFFSNISFKSYIEKIAKSSILIICKDIHLLDQNGASYPLNEFYDFIKKTVDSFSSYGGYINSAGEHVIDLKSKEVGPHFYINLLLGDRMDFDEPLIKTPKSVVDRFGRGSFRGDADFQILATRWDLRPEENGNPFNREFYVSEDGEEIFYSGSMNHGEKEGHCYHSQNETRIEYVVSDLKITRRIFILPSKKLLPSDVECQLVEIENLSEKARNLSIVFTGMFGLSNPDCVKVDIMYQTVITQSRLIKNDKGEVVGISPDYYPSYFKDHYRFALLRSEDGYIDEFTQDATAFLGEGTIEDPKGLNSLDNKFRMSGSNFFALKKNFSLKPHEKCNFDEFVGASHIAKDSDLATILNSEVGELLNTYPTHESLVEVSKEIREKYVRYSSFLKIKSKIGDFDTYVNDNLPFQVLYQTFVSRSFAQTQKGYREIGFREIQDLYASMYYLNAFNKRDVVKKLLKKRIENVFRFGYANHNFYYVGKEPGLYSDDQLRLVEAIYRYIKLTGDKDILKEDFAMADGGDRKLIETLKAIILYSGSISVGKHGLPLLDATDWNDCLRIDEDYLDGPKKEKVYARQLKKSGEKFGSPLVSDYSESVMNAFLLVIAMKDMRELTDDEGYRDELDSKIAVLSEEIRASSFIDGYYARVLINRKNARGITYIGSKGDGLSLDEKVDGSYYLNSFSWSVLSGVASDSEIKSMLEVIDRVLKTTSGFLLCSYSDLSLAGSKQAATEHYFFGDRENGGVFKHATMMMVVALLKRAKTMEVNALRDKMLDEAFYMLNIVLPYKVLKNPFILKGNPRFCTQYNNSFTEENVGPMLSGTATRLTLAIIEMVGIDFDSNTIEVKPMIPKSFEEFHAKIDLGDSKLAINISKMKDRYLDYASSEYILDGEKTSSRFKRVKDKREHTLDIIFY